MRYETLKEEANKEVIVRSFRIALRVARYSSRSFESILKRMVLFYVNFEKIDII